MCDHGEHGHGSGGHGSGGHGHGGHGTCEDEHTGDEVERGLQYSLFMKIDLSHLECLNEDREGSGQSVFKSWDNRHQREDVSVAWFGTDVEWTDHSYSDQCNTNQCTFWLFCSLSSLRMIQNCSSIYRKCCRFCRVFLGHFFRFL